MGSFVAFVWCYIQHVVGVPVPSGWFAPFRDGEHAQVVVGVGGGKEDFIDLCRTGAVAIPSGYDVAFLIWADGDGGVSVVSTGGKNYLAVDVDTSAKTVTIVL